MAIHNTRKPNIVITIESGQKRILTFCYCKQTVLDFCPFGSVSYIAFTLQHAYFSDRKVLMHHSSMLTLYIFVYDFFSGGGRCILYSEGGRRLSCRVQQEHVVCFWFGPCRLVSAQIRFISPCVACPTGAMKPSAANLIKVDTTASENKERGSS